MLVGMWQINNCYYIIIHIAKYKIMLYNAIQVLQRTDWGITNRLPLVRPLHLCQVLNVS